MSELDDILGNPTDLPRLVTPEETAESKRLRAAAVTEGRPLPQPWYDHLIQSLTRAQEGTREGHLALAAAWRAASGNLLLIAEAHEALAANVPDAAQAAADIGTAAERHDVEGLRGVLYGEQQLRERDYQGMLARLAALEAEQTAQAAYRREAREQRERMTEALTALVRALTAREGGNGDA